MNVLVSHFVLNNVIMLNNKLLQEKSPQLLHLVRKRLVEENHFRRIRLEEGKSVD